MFPIYQRILIFPKCLYVTWILSSLCLQMSTRPSAGTMLTTPDSKVHGANMGPIWGRHDPGEPHVGPMNFAIWDSALSIYRGHFSSYNSQKKFYHCNCCAVCTIVSYITAIYREYRASCCTYFCVNHLAIGKFESHWLLQMTSFKMADDISWNLPVLRTFKIIK